MSTTATTVGIKNSWSLISFAQTHGQMKVTSPFINKETGESFRSCAFIKEGEITMVSFSSRLGELTPQQIVSMKNELQVVQLETGNYKLCKAGHDTWADVDLDI